MRAIGGTNSSKAQMPQEQQNEKNKNRKGANKEVDASSLVSPGSL